MTRQSQPVAGVELGGTKCICTLALGDEIREQELVPTLAPAETIWPAGNHLSAQVDFPLADGPTRTTTHGFGSRSTGRVSLLRYSL